jgi:hypothetical protein
MSSGSETESGGAPKDTPFGRPINRTDTLARKNTRKCCFFPYPRTCRARNPSSPEARGTRPIPATTPSSGRPV